ncbi:hypothetical protein HCN44_004001 [Aphidius gifuensis]|uniref:Secreted protein n=1 Tax=Aphidius gifuensis TaxID=684658 RepID=A0A835CS26_APHGI|nr:uncharacterized protein LOC122848250 [Aphidius gifuensis]KAF7994529.1 hypothetical protein HCN44_004001 [Aphidius gifuensis]
MKFQQNIIMQLPMLVLIIALVSMCTVSSLKLPDLSSLWNKLGHGNETATNSTKTDNSTRSVNSTVTVPTLRLDDTATFNPDDILNHNKNKTSIIGKTDIKKTISIDEAKKLNDGKSLPVIPINGTKLPAAKDTPQKVPHDLVKEPESIDLATRKLFEREDYGPTQKTNVTSTTNTTSTTNSTIKKIT